MLLRPLCLMAVFFAAQAPAADSPLRLEILQWKSGSLEKIGEASLEGDKSMTLNGLQMKISAKEHGRFQRWEVAMHHQSLQPARLVLRLSLAIPEASSPSDKNSASYWDGLTLYQNPSQKLHIGSKRYRFPASTYLQGNSAYIVGFAPDNLSSRFESGLNPEAKQLYWDAYLALYPGQKDRQVFVTARIEEARTYPEVIEAYYLAWPEWFRPVEGADHRLYGEGGYFWSSDATRDLQKEEARRLHLDWEWYYAPFQRAGAVFATEEFWKQDIGFNLEETPWEYDQTGGAAAWERYNDARIRHADQTSAVFYYYLQQYADADLLQERFSDSYWINAEGKPVPRTFGWIKSGLWVQFAWPGETSYGDRLRKDLARAWERFAIAGFALDCVIGDIAYYGEALPKEHSKAFDDQGRIFVVEGIPIARNLSFTRNLPAKPDGQRAASIANEALTYHGAFYSDALMHEKPAYERSDLLPLRRILIGQKPYYLWKGYRAESLLNWENLTADEFKEGLQGIVDYSLLACLRYGAMPSMFFVNGYPQMHAWLPTLKAIQRAGWRAASFTRIPADIQPASIDPYSEKAPIWIARYGNAPESWLTISSPLREPRSFPLTIETERFANSGALYVNTVTGTATNRTTSSETEIDIAVGHHQPTVLEKVATLRFSTPVTTPVQVHVSRQLPDTENGELRFQFPEGFPKDAQILIHGEKDWRTCDKEISTPLPASIRLFPDSQKIAKIDLGNEQQSHTAILLLPEDRAELDTQATQLAHYLEYYHLRKRNSTGRLHTLGKLRQPQIVASTCDSLDAPDLAKARTVIVMGAGARRLAAEYLASGAPADSITFNAKNAQEWITVQPDKQPEALLWGAFLNRLDRQYPFYGGLEAGPMFQLHQMVGKDFPAAHTPTPAPHKHEKQE